MNSLVHLGDDSKEQTVLGGRLDSELESYQKCLNSIDYICKLTENEKDIQNLRPTIVVCGDQSMGKSSVLEIITGVDLPRGQGTMTRVPLELQLRRVESPNEEKTEISANFNSKNVSSHQLIQESQISDKIEEFTNILAGKEKRIVDRPITLGLYRRNLYNLTLIDLPGIVRISEDEHLPRIIKNMIERYMSQEQTIILNVVNASLDSVTAESLQLSKKHDPKCERTLVAFTFLDSVELDESIPRKYKECRDLRFDKSHIFFVRNRTGRENKDKVSLSKVQELEISFFESKRQSYHPVPQHCLGSEELTKKLVELQKHKILEIIPRIKSNLNKSIKETKNEINDFPNTTKSVEEATAQLFVLINEFFDALSQTNGLIKIGSNENTYNFGIQQMQQQNQELMCSKVQTMFETFRDDIRAIKKPKQFIDPNFLLLLRKQKHDSRGFSCLDDTHPKIALDTITEMINKIHQPATELVENVSEYVSERIAPCIEYYTRDRPNFREHLETLMTEIMDEFKKECQKCIDMMIGWELRPLSLDTKSNHNLRTLLATACTRNNNNNSNNNKYHENQHEQQQNTHQPQQKASKSSQRFSQLPTLGFTSAFDQSYDKSNNSNGSKSNNNGNSNHKVSSNNNNNNNNFIHPFEVELGCEDIKNDLPNESIGIYQIKSAINTNNYPIYQKMVDSKLYTIKYDEYKKKWTISESDILDKVANTTIIAEQEEGSGNSGINNITQNPILIKKWNVKGLYIESFDLLPLIVNNIDNYNKMDSDEQEMYQLAIKICCYWNEVACVGICRKIPQCVRDFLVCKPCGREACSQVQRRILNGCKDRSENSNNNDDKWAMYLMSLDNESMERKRECENRLKKLEMAKKNIIRIRY